MSQAKHEQLWQVTIRRSTDFRPYGERERDVVGDCSCGCKWYHPLEGDAGLDWGVCFNSKSQRAGMLTFEHQGCPEFELDE